MHACFERRTVSSAGLLTLSHRKAFAFRQNCRANAPKRAMKSCSFGRNLTRSFITGNSWHSCTLQSLETISYGLQQPVIYEPKWFVNILQTPSFLNLENQLERRLNFDPVCTSEIHISIWYVIAWASVLKYTNETLSPAFEALAFFSMEGLFHLSFNSQLFKYRLINCQKSGSSEITLCKFFRTDQPPQDRHCSWISLQISNSCSHGAHQCFSHVHS